jgi:hypothetical protein
MNMPTGWTRPGQGRRVQRPGPGGSFGGTRMAGDRPPSRAVSGHRGGTSVPETRMEEPDEDEPQAAGRAPPGPAGRRGLVGPASGAAGGGRPDRVHSVADGAADPDGGRGGAGGPLVAAADGRWPGRGRRRATRPAPSGGTGRLGGRAGRGVGPVRPHGPAATTPHGGVLDARGRLGHGPGDLADLDEAAAVPSGQVEGGPDGVVAASRQGKVYATKVTRAGVVGLLSGG